jgi:hypothetical protein
MFREWQCLGIAIGLTISATPAMAQQSLNHDDHRRLFLSLQLDGDGKRRPEYVGDGQLPFMVTSHDVEYPVTRPVPHHHRRQR